MLSWMSVLATSLLLLRVQTKARLGAIPMVAQSSLQLFTSCTGMSALQRLRTTGTSERVTAIRQSGPLFGRPMRFDTASFKKSCARPRSRPDALAASAPGLLPAPEAAL